MPGTVIVAFNAGLAVVAMAAVALVPRPPSHVAVVMAPASGPTAAVAAVAAAGGRLVSPTGRDWIVVAAGDGPEFVARLYDAGALLVIDADGLLGCWSG